MAIDKTCLLTPSPTAASPWGKIILWMKRTIDQIMSSKQSMAIVLKFSEFYNNKYRGVKGHGLKSIQ